MFCLVQLCTNEYLAPYSISGKGYYFVIPLLFSEDNI